jgi:spindle assembly abnormal protein 6
MELEHAQVLFDQEVTVAVQIADMEERRRSKARLYMTWASRLTSRNKILSFQLTEDTDLFFIYTLEISEEEFYRLKQEQNLLVDFTAFPVKFIELLHMCLACEKDLHPR